MSAYVTSTIGVAAAAMAIAIAACGGGDADDDRRFSSPADLSGATIGVSSLSSVTTLELRFVLLEGYGLSGDDVTLVEAPASSLIDQLAAGEIDAAVVAGTNAFQFQADARLEQLADVSGEMAALTGGPVLRSVLLSYDGVQEQKGPAIDELARLLAASVAYLDANRSQVAASLDEGDAGAQDYVNWWFGGHELALGDVSAEIQEALLTVLQVAAVLGDIDELPDPAQIFFSAIDGVEPGAGANGDRTTVSLAVLDDPVRRAALFALERGILTSNVVDVDVTYLPLSELTEAAAAHSYDVVEASPLVVPLGIERDLGFLVLSGAVIDRGGSLLFVEAE